VKPTLERYRLAGTAEYPEKYIIAHGAPQGSRGLNHAENAFRARLAPPFLSR